MEMAPTSQLMVLASSSPNPHCRLFRTSQSRFSARPQYRLHPWLRPSALQRFRSTTSYPLRPRCLCATLSLNGFAWCFCRARDKTLIVGVEAIWQKSAYSSRSAPWLSFLLRSSACGSLAFVPSLQSTVVPELPRPLGSFRCGPTGRLLARSGRRSDNGP